MFLRGKRKNKITLKSIKLQSYVVLSVHTSILYFDAYIEMFSSIKLYKVLLLFIIQNPKFKVLCQLLCISYGTLLNFCNKKFECEKKVVVKNMTSNFLCAPAHLKSNLFIVSCIFYATAVKKYRVQKCVNQVDLSGP